MSVAATTAASSVVLSAAAMRKVVEYFETAGATDVSRAIALPPKAPRATVRRLVRDRILVPVADDRFYLDREARARSQGRPSRAWRIAVIAAVIGLVVLLALALLGWVGGR